jgi:replicative DNA helicase
MEGQPESERERKPSLAQLLQNPPPEGGRNDWLTAVAGHYARRFRNEGDYRYHVAQANERCSPPLSAAECARVADSIWDAEQAKFDSEPDPGEVATEVRRLRTRKQAERLVAERDQPDDIDPSRAMAGDEFILDAPDKLPLIWGTDREALWAEGESLMLAGPIGAGKSTLAGQVVRARLGLGSGRVLDLPVEPTTSKVLYLAMDRPAQARRALYRQFNKAEREKLRERLVIWQGPPPKDFAKHPEVLLELARMFGADTVVIDSVKDAALGLSSDDVGAGYNRARQLALAEGVQVLELHHQIKKGEGGARPDKLADVYGSNWLTAGAGSVMLLWGEAGDELVDFVQLKPLLETAGPWKLRHNHRTGVTTMASKTPYGILSEAGKRGLTAHQFAQIWEGPGVAIKAAERMRASRKLQKLFHAGLAEVKPRGKEGDLYVALESDVGDTPEFDFEDQ